VCKTALAFKSNLLEIFTTHKNQIKANNIQHKENNMGRPVCDVTFPMFYVTIMLKDNVKHV